MKNINNTNTRFSLISFFLLKYQNFKNFTDLKSSNLALSYIKQAFLVISYYHKYGRKILFVGFPLSKKVSTLTTLKNSNHYFIQPNEWSKNIFRYRDGLNENDIVKKSSLEKNYFSNIPKLVVICNANPKEVSNIVCDANKINVPVIILQSYKNVKLSCESVHCVFGNYKSNKLKKFLIFLIYSIIKTPKL